jgi:hypothetical protein
MIRSMSLAITLILLVVVGQKFAMPVPGVAPEAVMPKPITVPATMPQTQLGSVPETPPAPTLAPRVDTPKADIGTAAPKGMAMAKPKESVPLALPKDKPVASPQAASPVPARAAVAPVVGPQSVQAAAASSSEATIQQSLREAARLIGESGFSQ